MCYSYPSLVAYEPWPMAKDDRMLHRVRHIWYQDNSWQRRRPCSLQWTRQIEQCSLAGSWALQWQTASPRRSHCAPDSETAHPSHSTAIARCSRSQFNSFGSNVYLSPTVITMVALSHSPCCPRSRDDSSQAPSNPSPAALPWYPLHRSLHCPPSISPVQIIHINTPKVSTAAIFSLICEWWLLEH